MTHQVSSNSQPRKFKGARDHLGLLAHEYCQPSADLEMVFNTDEGELLSGRGLNANRNVVLLY